MPNIFKRVKDGLTGGNTPQHPRAQSATDHSSYTSRTSPAQGAHSQQHQYPSQQEQDDAQLQAALEQSELEAALAASRLASNSGASPSGRPPRPAAVEHAGPSDDEELKLALAMSEAEAKQAAKGKGVLRQSTSERELEQALQESAQHAPSKHQHRAPPSYTAGQGSASSHQQQADTEEADLARALYESEQLAAASSARKTAASGMYNAAPAPPADSSHTSQMPSAPMLASPAAAQGLQQSAFPASHFPPQTQSSSQSIPSSRSPVSSPTHKHRHAQPGSQPAALYPPIFQSGMPISNSPASSQQQQHQPQQQSSSSRQSPAQHQPQQPPSDSHSPLYLDGHHGSAHLESMLSADEAFAKALQDEEFAGAVTEMVHQAPAPPTQPYGKSMPQSSSNTSITSSSSNPAQSSAAQSGSRLPQSHPHAQMPLKPVQHSPVRGLPQDPSACAGCGKPLQRGVFQATQFVTVGGVNYHPDCFCCGACHKPIGANVQFGTGKEDGLPYHMQCYRERFDPRCAVCHDFIPSQGGMIRYNHNAFWKQRVCPRHVDDGTIKCCSCNRWQPQGEQWVTELDGRTVCLDCLTTIVRDTADAQPLYRQVLAFYQQLGMPLPEVPPLMLVETSALNAAEDKEGRAGTGHNHGPVFHTRGLTLTAEYHAIQYVTTHRGKTYTQPMNLADRDRYEVTAILVLYGFPYLLTGAILAHECMHAWLRLRGITRLPLQTEEGLCQLMGLLWLEAQDLTQQRGTWEEKIASYFANQIRTDPSDVYGEGFRIALEAYQTHGLQNVIAHIQQRGCFP